MWYHEWNFKWVVQFLTAVIVHFPMLLAMTILIACRVGNRPCLCLVHVRQGNAGLTTIEKQEHLNVPVICCKEKKETRAAIY